MSEEQLRRIIPKPGNEITSIESEIIAASDSTYIVSTAARICVGMDPIDDYEKRCKHIDSIIAKGHESVLEHTNIVILLYIPKNDIDLLEYSEFLSACKYLNLKTAPVTGDVVYLLIGGSIRGYKQLIRNTPSPLSNRFVNTIINCMYSSAEACFFSDLIHANIMDKHKFTYLDTMKLFPVTFKSNAESDDDAVTVGTPHHGKINYGRCSILATEQPTLHHIFDKVRYYGFTELDVLDMVCVSVIFSDVSRPIANQIVRHRNAISQESQRYVNYSNKAFIDPMQFTDTRDARYTINGESYSSQELGDWLCTFYKDLVDQGMLKQEARSFLPSNVCTKLIVTFTVRNLMHFFDLRLHKSAQAEIRKVAMDLIKVIKLYDNDIDGISIENAISPIYELEKLDELKYNEKVDEVIEEHIENE